MDEKNETNTKNFKTVQNPNSYKTVYDVSSTLV